jgi:hypothetical protein
MDAKEAVAAARAHFAELFSEKSTLEEIWFDDGDDCWFVTMGVQRPYQPAANIFNLGKDHPSEVTVYKVVRIDNKTGKPSSIKNREGGRAA